MPFRRGLRRFMTRIRTIPRRAHYDAAMREEFRFHREMEAAKYIAGGMSPMEANRVAAATFGRGDTWIEAGRDELRFRAAEDLAGDVRYALRRLRSDWRTSAALVGILAIGVTANVGVFEVIDAILLQAPPVARPRELVQLWPQDLRATSDLERYLPLSYPQYVSYRDHASSLADLAAYDGDPNTLIWRTAAGAELLHAQFVSPNFFAVLGVQSLIGRVSADGDGSGVLSHQAWLSRFGADSSILGRVLILNGRAVTVVGVAEPGFSGLLAGLAPDIWLPLTDAPAMLHDRHLLESRGSAWLFSVVRLQRPADRERALSQSRLLARQMAADDTTQSHISTALFPLALVPGPYRIYVAGFTGLLQVLTILVLVIAGANAVNLLLAQGASRAPELTVRMTLGASSGRLFRQIATETLLLALTAGLVGLVAGRLVTGMLIRLIPASLPVHLVVHSDWKAVALVGLIVAVVGLAFGAIVSARARPGAISQRTASRRTSRFRGALVVMQLAVSLVLLIAAGLCIRGVVRARDTATGFEIDGRYTLTIDLRNASDTSSRELLKEILSSVARVPGVISASAANYLPLETTYRSVVVGAPTRRGEPPSTDGIAVQSFDVGPAYFRTMGTPLRGREFEPTDATPGAPVVVVNDALARRWWPGENAIGHTLRIREGDVRTTSLVVGVAATGKYRSLAEEARPVVYRAALQNAQSKMTVVAHTRDRSPRSLRALRDALTRVDPNLLDARAGPLADQLDYAMLPLRVAGMVLTVVGALGLVLGVAGLASSLAYGISLRTREIGIRMALGAQRRTVLIQFAREVGRSLALAELIGLPIAFGVVLALRSTVAGAVALAPSVMVFMSLLLGAATVGASLLAVGAALRIEPVEALRHE